MGGCRGITVPQAGAIAGYDYYPGGLTIVDPYAALDTWYIDPVSGVDTTGHQAAGYVYKTYQSALNDVFFAGNGGNRRIIVLNTATVTVTGTPFLFFPAGGPDAAHPCVLQGDPASTTLPVIDGAGTSDGFFCWGASGGQSQSSRTIANAVIRKIEMQNTGSSCFVFTAGSGGTGSTDNVRIEYCYGHNIVDKSNGSAGETGFAYWPGGDVATNITFSHCKIIDVSNAAGSYTNDNLSCFGSYAASNITVDHCLLQKLFQGVRFKTTASPPATQSNWTITNNQFIQVSRGIRLSTQGAPPPCSPENILIQNNLFTGPLVPSGTQSLFMTMDTIALGVAATSGSVIGNTVGQDAQQFFEWSGNTGMVVRDNLSVASNAQLSRTPDITDTHFNANCQMNFTTFDYNGYGNSSRWDLDFAVTPFFPLYHYSTFARWQAAYTSPLDHNSAATSPPPPDLSTLPGSHNPDQNATWIPNLGAPYNSIASNFADANYINSHDYTLAAASPLRTASSTGSFVGYDPSNCGPGW